MKHRSPIAVLLLPLVTFGIYSIYWFVSTKGEMNTRGSQIPTAWLLIVPIVNIWWLWKYCEGVQKVTGEKLSGVLAFLLLWLLGSIGGAIVQDSFNKVADNSAPATSNPVTPIAPTTPADTPPVAPAV